MTQGWSETDKQIVKSAAARAKKRAEEQIIKEFKNIRISTFEDLWALEQQIQRWHKDTKYRFGVCFETVEKELSEHLKRGWLTQADLKGLSEPRFKRILS